MQAYNKLYLKVPALAKAQTVTLLSLLIAEEPVIKVSFMDVQMQSGGYMTAAYSPLCLPPHRYLESSQGASFSTVKKMRTHSVP